MHAQEQINLYIAELPEWQRKLLVRLRQLVHSTDEEVEETWKWNSPHFDHDGVMIGFAAFKNHVAVWFHKGALIKDTKKLFASDSKTEAKGMRGYKLKEADVIDEKAFVDLVSQAVKLNQSGVKLGDAKPTRKALEIPAEFQQCFETHEEAWKNWNKFSYSHKKEYVEWINDAKQEESRKRRMAKALEMIHEGLAKNDAHKVS